jgi:hypothetical protein
VCAPRRLMTRCVSAVVIVSMTESVRPVERGCLLRFVTDNAVTETLSPKRCHRNAVAGMICSSESAYPAT